MQHVPFPVFSLSVFTLIVAAVVATARLFDALAKLLRALIEFLSAIRRGRKTALRSQGLRPVERDRPTATIKVGSAKPRRRLRPVRDRVGRSVTQEYRWRAARRRRHQGGSERKPRRQGRVCRRVQRRRGHQPRGHQPHCRARLSGSYAHPSPRRAGGRRPVRGNGRAFNSPSEALESAPLDLAAEYHASIRSV